MGADARRAPDPQLVRPEIALIGETTGMDPDTASRDSMMDTHQDTHRHPLLRTLTSLVACDDLPRALPDDPMPILQRWYREAEAAAGDEDFNAMTLATATPRGAPSARIVLCKAIETDPPAIIFYTSYHSRKGREIEHNPLVSAVFHWPGLKRQVRVEGRAERTSPEESDAYFRSRPLLSRIGAVVSPQSEPIESRERLVADATRLGTTLALGSRIERPPHWGGFRIHIQTLELWSARAGRLHDRARWSRGPSNGWKPRRLAP